MAANYTMYLDNTVLRYPFQAASTSLFLFSIVLAGTWLLWTVTSYFSSPLRKCPGPFLAKLTRLWYLYQVYKGDSHLTLHKLHQKYGPIIRIAPNIIDLDSPELIPNIYVKDGWPKTPFYHGSSILVKERVVFNLFSQPDPVQHRKEREPIAKLYSMASINLLQAHVDTAINKFSEQLDEWFVDPGKVCDLGQWILFYAWDVVGTVTFSKPFGYLEEGCDFDGTLHNADRAMDYFAMLGTVPFMKRFFDKIPFGCVRPPSFNTVASICVKHLRDRAQGIDRDYHDIQQPDFLDQFIEVKKARPDEIDDTQIIAWLMINTIAGADTTAITIRSALYFALKHPRVWERLTEEILAADLQGTTPPSYQKVKALEYTDAVIREAIRILPGVSMTMERSVPKEGFVLPNNDLLPGGIIVGMNPYIIARNPSIYGEDADQFRPERWLRDEPGETEEAFKDRLKRMNKADLSFGKGSRSCIGKNLGLLQTHKVLATLVARYSISLANPEREWKVTNSWFPRQRGLIVRLKRR